MPGVKGRKYADQRGEVGLYADVRRETAGRLDRIAAALGTSRARAIDALVAGLPLGPDGLPPWLHTADPLPLELDQAS